MSQTILVQNFRPSGTQNKCNITAPAVVKAAAGVCSKMVVTVATTTAITLNDSATVAGAAASNAFYTSPAVLAVGTVIPLDFPCKNGIVVGTMASGTVAISYG